MNPDRKVIVIAGPNGAGKTFETTLSGRGYLRHIRHGGRRAIGWS